MPLINTSVPNLIQGVSQQPDATRFAGQCEEQENALSSVVDGLKKRPNTRHIARLLGSAIANNSFIHFIDRDANEKYVIIHDGTTLRAFNILTGATCTINGANSAFISTTDYLRSGNPIQDINALTISDVTFLNNRNKTVAESLERTPDNPKEAIAVVSQGDYQTNYKVELSSQPITTGSSGAGTAVQFGVPNLIQISGTNPPEYKLDASEFGIAAGATNAVQTTQGDGYHAGNKDVTASSNGAILTNPQFDANLGTGTSSDKITSIDLLNAGRFASVAGATQTSTLSFTNTYSLTPLTSGHTGGGNYTYTVSGTVTLNSSSLSTYIAAGSPILDLSASNSGLYVEEVASGQGVRQTSSMFGNVQFD